ncbi:hypothetical protein KIN20_008277 [Parelaphostrongylus tenuis]|uniref:Uncharacterized protein n=1 Tax=Parelaphostrongylus tenuis TaxID=148309 RepID=A0AAD5MMM0_PARTN|nr:hypothetical protein KIN20_008277 [Parelaphostrongylus tenuis]
MSYFSDEQSLLPPTEDMDRSIFIILPHSGARQLAQDHLAHTCDSIRFFLLRYGETVFPGYKHIVGIAHANGITNTTSERAILEPQPMVPQSPLPIVTVNLSLNHREKIKRLDSPAAISAEAQVECLPRIYLKDITTVAVRLTH